MWNEIYLEEKIKDHPRAMNLVQKFKKDPIIINRYDDIWGRSKKPYLHKRDSLNLFIAKKEGQLVKKAPDAYGTKGDLHFYFIHAYNCIYECQYCYLQGYFNSPDIVLFINHDDIISEMKQLVEANPDQKIWFHAGEFSDSLALSPFTGELSLYHEFCLNHPNAIIELRTKSSQIKELQKLTPLKNFIISFSLAPLEISRRIDLKTPSTSARLKSMKELLQKGHSLAAHFDPIVFHDDFKKHYQELLLVMRDLGLTSNLHYLSLGVVRFTKEVYRETLKNYPDSLIHASTLIPSFDGKIRYQRPLRMWMLQTIKELCLQHDVAEEKIYLCMEEN